MKEKTPSNHKKYELKFEYDECISIWKFDNYKSTSGPFEVEIKYHKKKTK